MYKMELVLSNSHVDEKEQLKYVAILNALQDIEGLHINYLHEFTNYLNKNNLGVFLMYRQIEIIKKPQFGEKIILKTYPYNTNSIGGYRHIYIEDEKGNVLVKTNAFGAYVNLETFIPERIPKEIIKTIPDGTKDLSIKDYPRKIKYEDDNFTLIGKEQIRKSHIDRYQHVNNAYYLEFVLNYYKEFLFNIIRIEYIKSFVLNDIVYIYEKEVSSSEKIYLLKNQKDELCAIVQLIAHK